IMRDGNEISDIGELPSFLLNYKSEYHYLFYKIKSFATNPTTEFESLYQLPNIIRRFLEAFIGFKYSVGLKKGLDILISNESERIKVDKFVNNLSHQAGLSRSLFFTDINECKKIVDIVLEAVKRKDGEHYKVIENIYDENHLSSLKLNERQMMYVKENGPITNNEYQKVCVTSESQASADLAHLVSSKLIEQIGTTGTETAYILKGP
ncbi:MAG: hypothetical protein E4G94_05645, partial [ANME-2 cluster archaeon]